MGFTLLPYLLSSLSLLPFLLRLERPLGKPWRTRRGPAHGPAGSRAPRKLPPSFQTTMIWATTCGQTCFKVRPKDKCMGYENPQPSNHWARKDLYPQRNLRPQDTSPGTLISQPPRATCMPGLVPNAGNVQSPGKSVLKGQMVPPSWQSALPPRCTSGVLICQEEASASLVWPTLVTVTLSNFKLPGFKVQFSQWVWPQAGSLTSLSLSQSSWLLFSC